MHAGGIGGAAGLGGNAGTGAVAGSGGRSCNPSAPFGEIRPLNELNSGSVEARGWLSDDLLTAYFDTKRASARDIWAAKRSSPDEFFEAPSVIEGPVTQVDEEAHPWLSRSGLLLFYNRLLGGTSWDIFVAERASTTANFGVPSPVAGLNTTAEDIVGSTSADDHLFFLETTRGGNADIYVSQRTTGINYGMPAPVTELNTSFWDGAPIVTPDARVIYFGSERSGSWDIFRASRSSTGVPFSSLAPVAELNTGGRDWPSWISADDCVILFGSVRSGGAGDWDLFMARRPAQ